MNFLWDTSLMVKSYWWGGWVCWLGGMVVGWVGGRKRAIRHFGKIASIRFPDFNIENRMLMCNHQN